MKKIFIFAIMFSFIAPFRAHSYPVMDPATLVGDNVEEGGKVVERIEKEYEKIKNIVQKEVIGRYEEAVEYKEKIESDLHVDEIKDGYKEASEYKEELDKDLAKAKEKVAPALEIKALNSEKKSINDNYKSEVENINTQYSSLLAAKDQEIASATAAGNLDNVADLKEQKKQLELNKKNSLDSITASKDSAIKAIEDKILAVGKKTIKESEQYSKLFSDNKEKEPSLSADQVKDRAYVEVVTTESHTAVRAGRAYDYVHAVLQEFHTSLNMIKNIKKINEMAEESYKGSMIVAYTGTISMKTELELLNSIATMDNIKMKMAKSKTIMRRNLHKSPDTTSNATSWNSQSLNLDNYATGNDDKGGII